MFDPRTMQTQNQTITINEEHSSFDSKEKWIFALSDFIFNARISFCKRFFHKISIFSWRQKTMTSQTKNIDTEMEKRHRTPN